MTQSETAGLRTVQVEYFSRSQTQDPKQDVHIFAFPGFLIQYQVSSPRKVTSSYIDDPVQVRSMLKQFRRGHRPTIFKFPRGIFAQIETYRECPHVRDSMAHELSKRLTLISF